MKKKGGGGEIDRSKMKKKTNRQKFRLRNNRSFRNNENGLGKRKKINDETTELKATASHNSETEKRIDEFSVPMSKIRQKKCSIKKNIFPRSIVRVEMSMIVLHRNDFDNCHNHWRWNANPSAITNYKSVIKNSVKTRYNESARVFQKRLGVTRVGWGKK